MPGTTDTQHLRGRLWSIREHLVQRLIVKNNVGKKYSDPIKRVQRLIVKNNVGKKYSDPIKRRTESLVTSRVIILEVETERSEQENFAAFHIRGK